MVIAGHFARNCPHLSHYFSDVLLKTGGRDRQFLCSSCGLPARSEGIAFHAGAESVEEQRGWNKSQASITQAGLGPGGQGLGRNLEKSGWICDSGVRGVFEGLCWFAYWESWEKYEGIWEGSMDPRPGVKEFQTWLGAKGHGTEWANVAAAFCKIVAKGQ